ncbi:DUF1573 domain-containing protein [Bacteroides sp.]|uniref:DUF1573 domain-containing protein n=1 Tax=Bacteroides sp. TaxID=29523 RepID=UPI0025BA2FFC|nr:DUF1573 domain-containing protein [Bacteroides sp.]
MNTVKEWEGKEIKFPTESVFTQYMYDTVKYDTDLDFKLMVYVDSTGCTSCKLQLHKWKSFLHEMDSVSNDKIALLFYVCPNDKREFEHILKRDKFDYPICIDEYDSLNIMNHFSSDPRFQVFLLDKKNRVIAVGSPILNPKIKELYFNILLGTNNDGMNKIPQTQITITEQMINMGSFSWKDSQEKDLIIRNVGDSPLVIDEILTSCGCIIVTHDKKPVSPKDSTCIKIRYQAEYPEHFNKTITVYCNAEGAPLKLRISGNAK